jgi:hypothetical protein
MAAFLNRSWTNKALTRQTRKISAALINNPAGKKCLVRRIDVQCEVHLGGFRAAHQQKTA